MTERRHFSVVLRRRFRRLEEYFNTGRRQYPRTREALRLLKAALDGEVPRPVEPTASQRKRKGEVATGAGAGAAAGALEAAAPRERRWYYQARRFRQERDALAEKVRHLSGAKDSRNMLSEEWLLRVILSHPNASARSVEQSFADIAGSDVRTQPGLPERRQGRVRGALQAHGPEGWRCPCGPMRDPRKAGQGRLRACVLGASPG